MVPFGCGTVSGLFLCKRKWEKDSLNDDSAVRTGQAHRTLLGHTAPVTCLQFDEIHVVTGSLDKCIRVRW
jgi:hypothetical protein